MSLFKSSEERRIEREMRIRQGIRRIERSIREQGKFQEDYIKQAQQARKVGDESQYQFIRASLKRTATIRKMLERQLLAVKNALLVKRQAEAAADFSSAMATMAREIGRLFGETDVTKTQIAWEKALSQSNTMEERMGLFLDTIEGAAMQEGMPVAGELVTDQEVDDLIAAESQAEHAQELDRLAGLRAELDALRREGERQR